MADQFPSNWEDLQAQLRADLNTAIAVMLQSVQDLNAVLATANATINANPAVAIKMVANETKSAIRVGLRLARLQVAAFDSGDTGS